MMELLLTTEEVADWLRVDVVTVRRLVGRGELVAYRVGSEYRFRESDLEAYLTRCRVNDAGAPSTNHGDKFTERARNVLMLARDEATRFNHKYVDAEHLLLGLVRDDTCVAAMVLTNLGVGPAQVRSAMEQQIGDRMQRDGTSPDAADLAMESSGERGSMKLEVDLTPQADRVIQIAVDEAVRLGRRQVGTGQLLLGLVREDSGPMANLLRTLGVKLDKARMQTTHVLTTMQTTDD